MIPGYAMPHCSAYLTPWVDTLACGHSPHSILVSPGAFQLKLLHWPPSANRRNGIPLNAHEAHDLYGVSRGSGSVIRSANRRWLLDPQQNEIKHRMKPVLSNLPSLCLSCCHTV